MGNVGKLYAELFLDIANFSSSLKAASTQAKSIGTDFKSALKQDAPIAIKFDESSIKSVKSSIQEAFQTVPEIKVTVNTEQYQQGLKTAMEQATQLRALLVDIPLSLNLATLVDDFETVQAMIEDLRSATAANAAAATTTPIKGPRTTGKYDQNAGEAAARSYYKQATDAAKELGQAVPREQMRAIAEESRKVGDAAATAFRGKATPGVKELGAESKKTGKTIEKDLGNKASKSIGKISDATRKSSRDFRSYFKDLSRLIFGIVSSQIFYGFLRSIRETIKAAADMLDKFDEMNLSFKYLLNTTDAGAAAYSNTMRKWALNTEFNIDQVAEAFRSLYIAGVDPKDIESSMYILTGVASAFRMDLQDVVDLMDTVKSASTVSTSELRRFKAAGIEIGPILRETLHLTDAQMAKINELNIPGETMYKALLIGMQKYAKAGQEAAQTSAALSKNVKELFTDIAGITFSDVDKKWDAFLKHVLDILVSLRAAIQKYGTTAGLIQLFPPEMRNDILTIRASLLAFWAAIKQITGALSLFGKYIGRDLVAALAVVLPAISRFLLMCAEMLTYLMENVPAVRALAAGLGMLAIAGVVAAVIKLLVGWIIKLGVVSVVTTLFKGLAAAFSSSIWLGLALIAVIATIVGLIIGNADKINNYFTGIVKGITDAYGGFSEVGKIKEDQTSGIDKIGDSFEDLKDDINGAAEAFKPFLASFDEVYNIPAPSDKSALGALGKGFDLPDFGTLFDPAEIPDLTSLLGFGQIGEDLTKIWNDVCDFFKGVWKWLVDAYWWIEDNIFAPVDKVFKAIDAWVAQAFRDIGSFFKGVFAWIGQAIRDIGKFFAGVFAWIGQAIKDIGGFFAGIGKWIGQAFRDAGSFIVGVFKWVWNTIKSLGIGAWNIIKSVGITIWTAISTAAVAVWDAIKSVAIEFWDAVKRNAENIWNVFSGLALGAWNIIKAFALFVWEQIKGPVMELWNGILTAALAVWDIIKTVALGVWDTIKNIALGLWEAIKTAGTGIWEAIKTVANTIWDLIKEPAIALWNGVKEAGEAIWDSIKKAGKAIWEGIKTAGKGIWNAIQTVGEGIWSVIKTAGEGIWGGIKTIGLGIWDGIKTAGEGIWNGIKSAGEGIWSTVEKAGTDIWTGIKKAGTDIWADIQTTAGGIWDFVSTTATDWFQIGKDAIGKFIEGFKNIVFPKIKINVEMVPTNLGFLGNVDLPKFTIKWNKLGGIFDKASLIGVAEAGKEAVVPLSGKEMMPFAQAIADILATRDSNRSEDTRPTAYIQYLIADEQGLRELERRLRVVRIGETLRSGANG